MIQGRWEMGRERRGIKDERRSGNPSAGLSRKEGVMTGRSYVPQEGEGWREDLCYGNLNVVCDHTCMQTNPRRSRLIIDDGPPYGPGTTDPSSASKRDSALQSPGAAPLPLGSPASVQRETSLCKCLCLFPSLNHGCHLFLATASLTSP